MEEAVEIGRNFECIDSSIVIGNDQDLPLPNTLSFRWGNPPSKIVIHHDGKVEIPALVSLDDASNSFWEAIGGNNPVLNEREKLFNRLSSLLRIVDYDNRPTFKVGDRERLKVNKSMSGKVSKIDIENFDSNTFRHNDGYSTISLRLVTFGNNKSVDYELEYDPLEQLATEA